MQTSIVTACCVIALAASIAHAGTPPDPAFRESVRELMRLTGSNKLGEQMANGVFESVVAGLRSQNPDLSDRQTAIVQQVAAETFGQIFDDQERVLDAFAPIYAKHFTKQEIDDLIRFYRTPVGQKTIKAMPAVMQESMAVGGKWVQEIQPRFSAELKRRLEQDQEAPSAPAH